MNKRAFLLAEETIKMVIALIALTFLVYFLTSLYFANAQEKELDLAEESLNFLVQEIESGNKQIEIYNPSGWVITSWTKDKNFPKSCSSFAWESCICVCNSVGTVREWWTFLPITASKEEVQSEYCDHLGTCAKLDNEVPININLEKPFPIFLKVEGNKITQIKNG